MDIVEMLRNWATHHLPKSLGLSPGCNSAADEIERLRDELSLVQGQRNASNREIERLRDELFESQAREAKLRESLNYAAACLGTDGHDPIDVARALPTDDSGVRRVVSGERAPERRESMSNDEIRDIALRLARETLNDREYAALTRDTGPYDVTIPTIGLERLIRAAMVVERERCAKVCEEISRNNYGDAEHTIPNACAAAIRALGDEA